ncbi:hypothetical protein BKA69DRAFT_1098693 [Paraphysoderma sedebokerense]|nr:hypothetical protein BKA69DRAFT_1098693 [Paraphysoderma sedebokerense]
MPRTKTLNFVLTFILTVSLLCSVWAQNPNPWFLANVNTVPLTAADAVIIDAVFNNTHLVVLDSYFRLRSFTYTSTSASLSKIVDISSRVRALEKYVSVRNGH